jgi:hypothetical protein
MVMTVEGLAVLLGKQLRIVRQPNVALDKPWQAQIVGTEVKNGGILTGTYGSGVTPGEALAHYCTLIAGQRLVVDARSEIRMEITVPSDLEVQS